jgi:glycosyltransferase involved in cell wall biosynthesis
LEVIITFNNCDLDRVDEIYTKYTDIKIGFFPGKLYPGQAKNMAIKNATGKYLVMADDDDICLPEKFFNLAEYLESHPEKFAVCGQYNVRTVEGKIVNTNCGGHDNVGFDTLIQNNYIASGSIMYRNDALVCFDDVTKGFGEEWMLNLKLLSQRDFGHVKVPVYIWTMDNGFTKQFRNDGVDWKKLVKENREKALKLWGKKND